MPAIGFLVFDGFQVMGMAALSVFEMANHVLDRPAYEVHVLSEHGGPVKSSLGFNIDTAPFGTEFRDTTITIGSLIVKPSSDGLLAYLREAATASRRVAGICTGAFVLAEAGLLDGRRATTHWGHARSLQRQYPRVQVEEDRIFSVDGNVWTSAGMSAGVDMALALVENDFGQEVAKAVARKLVVYLRRAGGQSQFSTLLELEPKSDRVRKALIYAKENLKNELSVEELAEAASLSPRQFSRVFRQETGQSPAKAVEHLRLEAARVMMEEGRHPMDVIARETGFADRERMRRAFLRTYGQPPQVIRRSAENERAHAVH
ncbi:GlxA family transcriptional regulator [Azospirillum rugosum]|uniref:Transcriptional regulator GlxA family with amidase domain n=1 Tax=Azospirillum rugosum TaxID=416170 RepID=A0ABS4SVF1_9PROT|nr:GlxA family transcriptional regulator [Azospirillum rugosum]MBP2296534.1 transcriptional regulator GlxA family with amidase domain [Azospirillum rugosum]MDQ0530066.1 transcriptional regulator GlxA family with amidase domain [Azospirillum rugosum]